MKLAIQTKNDDVSIMSVRAFKRRRVNTHPSWSFSIVAVIHCYSLVADAKPPRYSTFVLHNRKKHTTNTAHMLLKSFDHRHRGSKPPGLWTCDQTAICSHGLHPDNPYKLHKLLLIYKRDGRLSWHGWLTHRGHFTHKVVTCQPQIHS